MDLVPAHAIEDVGRRLFERACPLDIPFFVESSRQLHDDGHLFVPLSRPLQACNQRRSDARPIEGLLDGEDIRILSRLGEQCDDRVIGLVGVVQQHVALVERQNRSRCSPRGRQPAGAEGHEAPRTPAPRRDP